MTYVIATGDKFASGRGISLSMTLGLLAAAFAVAAGVAAWMTNSDSVVPVSAPLLQDRTDAISFEDRFSPDPDAAGSSAFAKNAPLHSLPFELRAKLQEARSRLAHALQAETVQTAAIDDDAEQASSAAAANVPAVPLPKSRPAGANVAEPQSSVASVQPDSSAAPEAGNRNFLQKLTDLLPGRIRLASLAPDGGLLTERPPNLAALGYDNLTAVYDISARAVYLPNGSRLEAHSGYGGLMDDPRHVNQRMVGATPPNVYNLKPREHLFHGVQALRMLPAGESGMFGRTGLLAHSYMLGPNGDSNGCVSIKDYDKFLAAYQNGEIKRLVVVASLSSSAN